MKTRLLKSLSEKYTALCSSSVSLASTRVRVPGPGKLLPDGSPIAILAPHPDDEIVGCFHFIQACGRTNPIDIYYVTDGSVGGGVVPEEELAQCRKGESLLATSQLSIRKREYWNLPDSQLHESQDVLREHLLSMDSDLKYAYVFSPSSNDLTGDHAILAKCALSVFDQERLVWYRSTWFTFPLDRADFTVSGNANEKLRVLRRFESQSNLALANTVHISKAEARLNGLDIDSMEAFRLAVSGECFWKPLNTLSIFAINKLRGWLENPSD